MLSGARAIAGLLTGGFGSSALTYLILANAGIMTAGGVAIGQAVATGGKPLVGLNLSGNPIGMFLLCCHFLFVCMHVQFYHTNFEC